MHVSCNINVYFHLICNITLRPYICTNNNKNTPTMFIKPWWHITSFPTVCTLSVTLERLLFMRRVNKYFAIYHFVPLNLNTGGTELIFGIFDCIYIVFFFKEIGCEIDFFNFIVVGVMMKMMMGLMFCGFCCAFLFV